MATNGPKRKATAKRTSKTPAERDALVRSASVSGAKAYYRCMPLAEAEALADTLPTLRSARLVGKDRKVPRSARSAEARRLWAESIGAPLVAVWEVAHANHVEATDGVGTVSDRPENALRSRVRSRAVASGKVPDYYYVIRAEAYAEGEVPLAYLVRL